PRRCSRLSNSRRVPSASTSKISAIPQGSYASPVGKKRPEQETIMGSKPVLRETLPARVLDAIGDFAFRTPARFAILVFTILVGIFTILFSLPVATASGQPAPFSDAFFTAVSVICVTGLSTVDMATY